VNEAFDNLARQVFTAANGSGPSKIPTGLERVVAHLVNGGELTSEILQTLGQSIAEQFPFLRQRSLENVQCDEAASAAWEAAVRAVLEHLRYWSPANPNAFEELSAMLYAIDALGLDTVDVRAITTNLRNDELVEGLYQLICDTEVTSYLPGHDRIPNANQEIRDSAQQGNFVKVGHLLRNVMPEPRAVLWSAVRLLWQSDPAKLAEAVTIKDSIYFMLLVRFTLSDDFPALAIRVPLVWVKYVAIENLEDAHRRGVPCHNSAELLHQLLLQAAETSAWRGWMDALLAAPYSGSLICVAFPRVLAKLHKSHWTGFVAAVNMGYSKSSAGPIADIMASFAQETDATAASMMWSLCFDRWREWDYGRNESQFYMFSPAACAFDYPVAKYYSEMSSHERDAEEAALLLAVESIEQQWFPSASDLITERNRLLSRLRLVLHGHRLASGNVDLLPPGIQASDAYSSVRYSYHDVQARN